MGASRPTDPLPASMERSANSTL
uniref:Uncharacterized protein n=1 Tax=Arundo donax TaxID=35708 RepID=A0A0A9FLY0_ARUDO